MLILVMQVLKIPPLYEYALLINEKTAGALLPQCVLTMIAQARRLKSLPMQRRILRTYIYKNEHSLSFEFFINNLNEIFFIFYASEKPYTPVQKVNKMCEKMNTSNSTLQAAMTVIKTNPDLKTTINEYFTKAENTLAEQVAIIFPNARAQTSRYVSFVDSGRGRGRGHGGNNSGGIGRGRGGLTHQSKQASFPSNLGGNTGDTWNGINISDLTCYFPRAQFMSFPPELRTRIHNSKLQQPNDWLARLMSVT